MKTQPKSIGRTAALVAAILALVGALYLLGFGSFRSAVRIGWTEQKTASSWSARYARFSGLCTGKLRTNTSPAVLHVEIETMQGTLNLEIRNADGDTVFFEESLPTSAFDVTTDGSVTVRLTAGGHAGSFRIGWQDAAVAVP